MSETHWAYEKRLQPLTKDELMFEWMSKMEQVALAQAEMVARVDRTCNPSLQPEFSSGCPLDYNVQYQATLDALNKERAAIEALVKQAAMAKILWQSAAKSEHEEDPDSLSTNVDGTVYR